MRFFEDAFSDPNNWEENPLPGPPQPAIEERVIDRPDPGEPEEIVEPKIVEPEGERANDMPPCVADMIKKRASTKQAATRRARSPMPNLNPRRKDLQPRADAMEKDTQANILWLERRTPQTILRGPRSTSTGPRVSRLHRRGRPPTGPTRGCRRIHNRPRWEPRS